MKFAYCGLTVSYHHISYYGILRNIWDLMKLYDIMFSTDGQEQTPIPEIMMAKAKLAQTGIMPYC